MAGVSAYLILNNKESEIMKKSLKISIVLALVFSIISVYPTGDRHAKQVACTQPEKFASLEGLINGQTNAPILLFGIPSSSPPDIKAKIEIPGILSWMTFGNSNAYVKGINDFPKDEVPPLSITFLSFHLMIGLGGLFVLLSLYSVYLLYRKKLFENKFILKILIWTIPFPVIACQFGWIVAEVGRQPWIVYKLLKTSQGFSLVVPAEQVLFSIILFSLVYILLGVLYIFLLVKKIKLGPEPALVKEEVK
jgi:cytochrome d ubiquinol oxidase subunit I